MTSAAAVVGLTYRGTDIQDIDGIYLEIVTGLIEVPQVRGVDLVVPSSAGRTVRNRVADRLSIELRGFIRGVATATGVSGEDEDRADFATNRAAFRSLFDPTLDPGPLVALLEDGSYQHLDARTLNVISDVQVPSWVNVSVELESVDADWLVGTS